MFPDAETYARLLAALYTGKNEKPASNIKTAHRVLSPCIFSKILFIYNFLTAALNCLPLSSKSSNRSKLAHAGESNTQSPDDEIL